MQNASSFAGYLKMALKLPSMKTALKSTLTQLSVKKKAILEEKENNKLAFMKFLADFMDDKTIITYFLSVVKKTGKYARSYKYWLAKPEGDKTYANLKEYWHQEHLKMKRSNPTARQYEYGMNAMEKKTGGDSPDIASILEQCANAMMTGQKQ